MNATQLAHSAYAPANTVSVAAMRPAKSTEYDAFAAITSDVKNATSPTQTANALHRNRQLWTMLAADVADPDNALPQQLRAQIFYLAEFTSQHTSKVLSGKADVDALVEINTAMMKGLRPQHTPG